MSQYNGRHQANSLLSRHYVSHYKFPRQTFHMTGTRNSIIRMSQQPWYRYVVHALTHDHICIIVSEKV